MKKIVMISALVLSLAAPSAQAITVKSGSKYPIIVNVYEYKSVCKKKGSGVLNKALKGAKKAKKSGGWLSGIKELVTGAVTDSGCSQIGKETVLLRKGKTMNVPSNTIIVAYKDAVAALENDKKLVSPLPTIFEVPDSGPVCLQTRNIALGRGDLGLRARFKKCKK